MDFEKMLVARIGKLRRYAWKLAQNPTLADDLVQETLLKAWRNRQSFTEGTNIDAWLNTILRNSFFSQYRRSKLIDIDSDSLALARAESSAGQEAAIMINECGKSIDGLPGPQREALLLVTVEGATYEEAANKMGCSTGTIKSRINRARSRLAAETQPPS